MDLVQECLRRDRSLEVFENGSIKAIPDVDARIVRRNIMEHSG